MALVTSYLSSLPPGQTTALLAFVPGFILLTAAFAIHHAMEVAGAKAWDR